MHQHQCKECGAVAAEPRLRYCEECGARMPEYKPPPLPPEDGSPGAAIEGSRRPKSNYTGPKWLEYVPAHSPTSVGIILHVLALWLSILPFLAGVGPFWSLVMTLGGLLMMAREYRLANLPNPLVDWIPDALLPSFLPTAYSALAVAITLPMLEFSIQPLLWLGGTVLVVRDQWGKGLAGPGGYIEHFEPRALLRGFRVLALAGSVVCVLSLFFTWTVEGEVTNTTPASSGPLHSINVPQPSGDSIYGGTGGLAVSGFQLRTGSSVEIAMGATAEIGLLVILLMLMLKPEVERPIWLRFVPAGIVVISLAWVLVNIRMKVGPIMFLAGLVPMGLVAFLQALGRDEMPEEQYAEGPPPDESYSHDGEMPPEGDFVTENDPYTPDYSSEEPPPENAEEPPPPEEDEDMRG